MDEGSAKFLTLSVTLIGSAPFLWALAFGRTKYFDALLAEQGKGNHNYVFLISRIMVAVGLIGAMVAQFVPILWALGITAWMAVVVGYVFATKLKEIYQWFENRFLSNLTDEVEKVHAKKHSHTLAPWDGHITEFAIPSEAPYVGQPLQQMGVRENFGVTIALIERGRKRIPAPEGHESFMPHDKVFVIGTDEQLIRFKAFVDSEDVVSSLLVQEVADYSLEQYMVRPHSNFIDKTIRDCGLREKTQGLVVGLEREGRRILNPDAIEVLKVGDLLWIVGDRNKILALE